MSTGDRRSMLDSRAWLAWGAAVSIPLLTGRHPLVIAELLIVVLVIRATCLPPGQASAWGWMLRVGLVAVPIGILFNMLTVRAGEQALFRIPGDIPVIGGPVTLNAVVYGAISGLTIVVLIAAGTTVAAGIDWAELMRLMRARAAGLAVAGSVAWAFLPQLAASWREIREAQAARGHAWRGPRDIVPLVVPLLAGGLDRSITMAEALEARGFGAGAATQRPSTRSAIPVAVAITAAVLGLYLFAVGRSGPAAAAMAVAGLSVLLVLRQSDRGSFRVTRYRQPRWALPDTVVLTVAVVAILATGAVLQVEPAALRYNPYPSLTWPGTSIVLLAALAMLMLPAVVAPATADQGAAR